MKERTLLLIIVLILVAAASLPLFPMRLRVEAGWGTVEKILDWWDIELLAARTGRDPFSLLGEARELGYSTVGVSDYDIRTLQAAGRIVPVSRPVGLADSLRYFSVPDPELREEIAAHLVLLGKTVRTEGTLLGVNVFPEEEDKISLGWNRTLIASLREQGYRVVLRPRNFQGIPPEVLKRILADDLWIDTPGMISVGDEVFGYGDSRSLAAMAEYLEESGTWWGYVEFVGQKGETALARLASDVTVRVHSIPPDELKNFTPREARDRFLRAVRERSIRLLYVRLFTEPSFTIWEKNRDYLASLSLELEERGFTFGPVEPLDPFTPGLFSLVLYGFAVALAFTAVYGAFFPGRWIVMALAGVFLLGMIVFNRAEGMRYMGFFAGLSFPALSVFLLVDSYREKLPVIRSVVLAFLVLFAGSLVVGLGQFDRSYVLRIDQYWGVKASLVVPIILVLLYLFKTKALGRSIPAVADGALRRYELIIVGILAVGSVLFLTRTGNFPLWPAGAIESRMRILLEEVMFMRPRTREFLLGYPALWLLFVYRGKGIRAIFQLLLWLGASIGFVTFFNSFCHIHTGLLFVLLRFLNALVLSLPVTAGYLVCIWIATHLWRWVGRYQG
ncbi:MAG TPA: DUF5693 family protein [Atribacteraceae bacterium]|nr:DUF5693 family protein [Atribacteraceae bacterium]